MASVACFYCPVIKAQQQGFTVTRTEGIFVGDAKKLRDYYANISVYQNYFTSLAAGILGLGISAFGAALGYTIATTTATSFGSNYMDQLAGIYDTIATSGCQFNKVKLTYQYVRKGSNDGAYWLQGVQFIS